MQLIFNISQKLVSQIDRQSDRAPIARLVYIGITIVLQQMIVLEVD